MATWIVTETVLIVFPCVYSTAKINNLVKKKISEWNNIIIIINSTILLFADRANFVLSPNDVFVRDQIWNWNQHYGIDE